MTRTALPEASQRASNATPLAPQLCYVCHTMLTSKGTRVPPALYPSLANPSTTVTMPIWTTSGLIDDSLASETPRGDGEEPVAVVRKKLGQEELRKAIDEFILDD